MRLDALIRALLPALEAAGVSGAGRDLRLLAAHVLGLSRDRLTLHLGDELSQAQQDALRAAACERAAGRPVSKIVGWREFWGRRFVVTDAVLDPRPETETLIVAACAQPEPRVVLDLGTGSGAIAVTLAAEWPAAKVTATDVSEAALEIARRNASAHGVALRLIVSDWFADVQGQFDLIVSNPPYISATEMAALSREVREFDPLLALTDGADGLSAYRVICAGAGGHLTPGGWLMVEIGWMQGAAVAGLFAQAGFDQIEVLKDMDQRDRVVIGCWRGECGSLVCS